MERLVFRAYKDRLDPRETSVRRVRKAARATLAPPDHRDPKGTPVPPEAKAPRAPKESRESRVQQVFRGQPVRKVAWAQPGSRVFRVTPA